MAIPKSLRTFILEDRMRLIYTVLIYFNNFAFGMCVRIISAMLVDLSYIYSTTINQVSLVSFSIGLGFLIGSCGNVLYKWINRQLALGFFLLMMSTLTTLSPHYGSLIQLLIGITVGSVGSGAWDSATSIWLVEMWPLKNAALLQGSQFMYGLGGISAPLLASPYLYGHKNSTFVENAGLFRNETMEIPLTIEARTSSLSKPLLFIGITQAMGAILYIVFYFILPFQNAELQQSVEELEKRAIKSAESEKIVPYRKCKLLLMGMACGIYIAAEIGHFSYAGSMYQLLEVEMSAADGARVMSTALATYTLGRLVAAVISLRVSPDMLMAAHYFLILGSLGLIFVTRNNPTWIFVSNALIGAGFSAVWPGMFAFTEHFIGLTPGVCAFYSAIAGGAMLILPLVLAQLFEKMPLILVAIETLFILASFTFFAITRFWIWLTPTTHDDAKRTYSRKATFTDYGLDNPVFYDRSVNFNNATAKQ